MATPNRLTVLDVLVITAVLLLLMLAAREEFPRYAGNERSGAPSALNEAPR